MTQMKPLSGAVVNEFGPGPAPLVIADGPGWEAPRRGRELRHLDSAGGVGHATVGHKPPNISVTYLPPLLIGPLLFLYFTFSKIPMGRFSGSSAETDVQRPIFKDMFLRMIEALQKRVSLRCAQECHSWQP